MKHTVSGSLTIFFCMTMVGIVTLMVVLYVAAQLFLAGVQSRKMMDLSASSTLAGYHQELHERYGLFAIENESVAENDFLYFMEMNFSVYDLEDLTLTKTAGLTDLSVYEAQVTDFMSYRMLTSILTQYADLTETLDDLDDASDALSAFLTLQEETETYCTYFSAFVTLLDGVDDTGYTEEDYAMHLFNDQWSDSAYEEMLPLLEGSGETYKETLSLWEEHVRLYLSIAEETLSAWEMLVEEGVRIEPILSGLMGDTDTQSVRDQIQEILDGLHTGDGDDAEIQEALEQNIDVLQEALEGLTTLIDDPDDEDARVQAEALLTYDMDISVDYTLSDTDTSMKSWKKLWNELQNYVTDLSVYIDEDQGIDEEDALQLPSSASAYTSTWDTTSLTELTGTISDSLSCLSDVILMEAYDIEYVGGMFRNLSDVIAQAEGESCLSSLTGEEKESGYLSGEMEYVIAGQTNDLENVQMVRLELIAVRMLSNLYYLMTDSEMKAAVASMSSVGGIVAPGFGSTILEVLITAVWAGLESIADYENLIQGGSVPLIKDDDSWQTDLDGLMEAVTEGITTEDSDEEENEGLSYADYLKILLLLVPQQQIELRTLDLIQLNLSETEEQTLLLSDMVTAFYVEGSFSVYSRGYDMEGSYGYAQ